MGCICVQFVIVQCLYMGMYVWCVCSICVCAVCDMWGMCVCTLYVHCAVYVCVQRMVCDMGYVCVWYVYSVRCVICGVCVCAMCGCVYIQCVVYMWCMCSV